MSASRITGADGWEAGPVSVLGSGRRIGVLSRSATELMRSIGVCTATE